MNKENIIIAYYKWVMTHKTDKPEYKHLTRWAYRFKQYKWKTN